jgi:hypothetical protein
MIYREAENPSSTAVLLVLRGEFDESPRDLKQYAVCVIDGGGKCELLLSSDTGIVHEAVSVLNKRSTFLRHWEASKYFRLPQLRVGNGSGGRRHLSAALFFV